MDETESMHIFVFNAFNDTLKVFKASEYDARALAEACINGGYSVIYFYAEVDAVILDLKE